MQIFGEVVKISGPLVVATGLKTANLFDVVKVGNNELLGEIIELHRDEVSIQVFEDTTNLGLKEKVISLETPLSIELGPGLIGNVFDGIGRPLVSLKQQNGSYLKKGTTCATLNRTKKWPFKATVELGCFLNNGDEIGVVNETLAMNHKILVPPGVSGELVKIESGNFSVDETIGVLKNSSGELINLKLMHSWPVKKPRPILKKMAPCEPLISGQRVIDVLFPIAKGGVAAVPGPFGSGKTIVQHQLAKWANVEVVVYIGCGERGNEIADVLTEFPKIVNPKTNQTLMDKTILIANTSDMPVAAREASIYTGITIAEYFRDMGFDVALMADSTSRWAEALREISGRLNEMPGEEGYPAYLQSRLSQFYERAGFIQTLGGKTASLSIVGAVSPPGGDISEPVSQATLRVVKVFWGLDSNLAYRRHFPSINWLKSYSNYVDDVSKWFIKNISTEWLNLRLKFISLLQKESEIEEIVKLIGINSISKTDRVVLEIAKIIKDDFLNQSAFHKNDTYCSLKKQFLLMKLISHYYELAIDLLNRCSEIDVDLIFEIESKQLIARFKFVNNEEIDLNFKQILNKLDGEFENLNVK